MDIDRVSVAFANHLVPPQRTHNVMIAPLLHQLFMMMLSRQAFAVTH